MNAHPHSSSNRAHTTVVDVANAFNALRDCIAIIDLTLGEVVWRSSTFLARFPATARDTLLDTLLLTFDGLGDCLAGMRGEERKSAGVRRGVVRFEGDEYYEAIVAPMNGDSVVLRMEDVAERERVTQRHLEDREQLLFTSRAISVSEMATTLAHELNQPIGTIANLLRGIGMRLHRSNGGSEEILAALDRATDQALFAAKIITRIRDYTHSLQPRREHIDIADLVCASVALLDWEIRRERIAVHLDAGTAALPVEGDEVMLQQVLVNLLRNAIDAMRGGAHETQRLEVRAQLIDSEVEITISDSGCGLSAEAEKDLFVPFISTKPTGMGVGLNICRSFVELHQGKLWVSHNEDVGCTFHVTLPVLG